MEIRNEGSGGGSALEITDGTTNVFNVSEISFTGAVVSNLGGGIAGVAVSGSGGGTVTTVSVASANGFAGTVANATTTPAITVSTSVTGVLKGNGTAISAAVAGTDFQAPITLTTTGTSGAATLISNTLNIPQYSGGGGSPGGSNTQLQYNNAGAFGGAAGITTNGNVLTLAPSARTSGTASYFTITAPADTGQTASTESKGINITGATRTWADGTVTTQREYFFGAPTYNKTTTAATFTNAGTVVISGSPIAGTGVTITNPYALWVQGGISHFGSLIGGSPLAAIGGLGVEIVDTVVGDGGLTLEVTNTSSATNAFTGVNLNNDNASASTYTNFSGLYYNSSTYTNTSFGTGFAIANQLALQNTDGPITISAQKNSSQYINYMIGGTATTNEVGRWTNIGLTVGLAGTSLGKVAFAGNTSGSITLQGQAVGGSNVITLPAATGSVPVILGSSGTASATTSSLTEVALVTVTIPAGIMGTNGQITILAVYKYVGIAGTKTTNIRHSTTSGDTSAGTLIYTNTSSSSALSQPVFKYFWNSNSASAQVMALNTQAGLGSSTSTVTTGSINTANASYINLNGFVTNAGDTCQVVSYTVTFSPAV